MNHSEMMRNNLRTHHLGLNCHNVYCFHPNWTDAAGYAGDFLGSFLLDHPKNSFQPILDGFWIDFGSILDRFWDDFSLLLPGFYHNMDSPTSQTSLTYL